MERTVRAPVAGEVRIEVKAAGVNPTDILFRDPGFGDQFGGDNFPIVPGVDAAGIIESVGPGVLRLRVGKKAMAAVMPVRPSDVERLGGQPPKPLRDVLAVALKSS